MYGGWPPRLWAAYVGEAGNLGSRIDQHFVRRDSSVATGVAAATLNPDAVRAVRWWEHAFFDDKVARQAAELVAFRILDPALRSRGRHRTRRTASRSGRRVPWGDGVAFSCRTRRRVQAPLGLGP